MKDRSSLRGAFVGKVATLESLAGPLLLGVVDPSFPGIAEGVSRLLVRSIQDAREQNGGHLPGWLVDDIERNYISPHKVQTLWAPTGHRFGVILDEELIGTIHVARDHETILTIDRDRINVPARIHPGFKPDGHHHVVNLSVKHELRRAGIGTAMVDGIIEHFRDLFSGVGLWVRADPPWHPGLAGLGFVHDPSMDVFLPETSERTAGLPHAELNRRYACDCRPVAPLRPRVLEERAEAMRVKKLQYVSFTRAFDAPAVSARRSVVSATFPKARDTTRDEVHEALAADRSTLERNAADWGLVHHVSPRAVARPATIEEVAALLATASAEGRRVTVRGKGHSVAGQSLGDDLVLSTEHLDRVVAVSDELVTVEGGASWSSVIEVLAPLGRYPRVVTGWLPATVGGTLAAGGFSKGSHRHGFLVDQVASLVVVTGDGRTVECSRRQAGWLFDAVLGGLGQFGVIVRATFPLVRQPPFVEVIRSNAGRDPAALLQTLEAAADAEDTQHVTSFVTEDGSWTVVQARARATLEASTAGRLEPLSSYLAPARPTEPPGRALWLHLFLPSAALEPFLTMAMPCLRLDGRAGRGLDAMQIIPVRVLRPHPSSLVAITNVSEGALVHAVCITRTIGDRSTSELDAENRSLLDAASRLGAASYLAGTLPGDAAGWRRLLGARYDELARAKKMADPAHTLGSPLVDVFGTGKQRPG